MQKQAKNKKPDSLQDRKNCKREMDEDKEK